MKIPRSSPDDRQIAPQLTSQAHKPLATKFAGSASDPEYRPEIDGLRAIAVAAVVIYHAKLFALRGGMLGVDIFFCISGFLITKLLISRQAGCFVSLGSFYERRVRRILPALLAMIAVCGVPAWLWMSPAQLRGFGQSAVAALSFLPNIYQWMTIGYFDTGAAEKPLLHLWSLGVEEQFYLLFPIGIALLRRAQKRAMAAWILILGTTSLIAAFVLCKADPSAAFYLAPTRAWELLAGSYVAVVVVDRPTSAAAERVWSALAASIGLGFILFALTSVDDSRTFPNVGSLLATAGTVLILAFSDARSLTTRLLSCAPFRGLGLISYSVYLWHQPIVAFYNVYAGTNPRPGLSAALCVGTGILALLSWRFVERPWRLQGLRSRNQLVTTTILAMSVLGACGLIAHLSDGFPRRFDSRTLAVASTATSSPMRGRCHTAGIQYLEPLNACAYFYSDSEWAVLGDSHGVELAYALATELRASRKGVVQLTFSNCPPALSFQSSAPGCSKWISAAVARIESDAQIRNVVIAYRYAYYLYGDQRSSFPAIPNSTPTLAATSRGAATDREEMWTSFELLVDRLLRAKKRVFVLLPFPELSADIERDVFRLNRSHSSTESTLGPSLTYYLLRNKEVLSRLARLPWGSSLIRIDPTRVFCDKNDCYSIAGGQALYFDDNHPSIFGARLVVGEIERTVPIS